MEPLRYMLAAGCRYKQISGAAVTLTIVTADDLDWMRTAHSSVPPEASDASDNEALELFNALETMIRFLGGVYCELSGHSAAAQRVIADLRRCLAFLHSRCVLP